MYIKVRIYNISSKICSSTINVLQGKLYLKRKYKIIGDKKGITGSDILIFPQSLYKYWWSLRLSAYLGAHIYTPFYLKICGFVGKFVGKFMKFSKVFCVSYF